MPIDEDHQVISSQVQLESFTAGIVESDYANEVKWGVALQEVDSEVLVCDHTRLAIDNAEVLYRMLGNLVRVFHWTTHV